MFHRAKSSRAVRATAAVVCVAVIALGACTSASDDQGASSVSTTDGLSDTSPDDTGVGESPPSDSAATNTSVGSATTNAATVALDAVTADSKFEVVSHVDAGGFTSNVWVLDDHAYLGSFGQDASALPPGAPGAGGDVDLCPTAGVRVYDISDSSDPSLVGTYADGTSEPDIDGTWNETVIAEHVETSEFTGDLSLVPFFRCAADGFQGFGLYDVTDPSSPERLSIVEIPNAGFGNQEPWLDVRDDSVYVYTANAASELTSSPDGATPGDPDFVVYDVSDPTKPERIAEWGAWAELGVAPQGPDENGVNRNRFVHTVYAKDDVAYLSYFDNGTVMLDVSDPSKPTFIGQTSFEKQEAGNAEHSWVSDDGLLIETAEHFPQESEFMPALSGPSETAWGYVRTYDISDPTDPQRLGTFETAHTRVNPPPPGAVFYTPNFVRTQGDIAFFAWTGDGVIAVDMSDPTAPRQLAQFTTPATPDPYGFFFAGLPITYVWGLDFHGDEIVVSDANSGLWILRLTSGQEGSDEQSQADAVSQPLNIEATDGTFEMPSVLDAGVYDITFNNTGEGDHHAEIYRLNNGVDFGTFFAESATGPDAINAVATALSGPATTPGGTSERMSMAFERGRYVIIDVLPAANGNPNFLNGMMREFIVENGDADPVPPTAEPELTMGEFTFGLPDTFAAGTTTFGYRNVGLQQHELTLVRLDDDQTLEETLDYFDELIPSGPPEAGAPPAGPPPGPTPFTYAGGLMSMASAQSGTVDLTLEPGRYAFICTLVDPDSGKPHSRLGMAEEITVR